MKIKILPMDKLVEDLMINNICRNDIFMYNINENKSLFSQTKKIFQAKLVRVIDGDEQNVCVPSFECKIRFYGIDAPEATTDRKQGQPFSRSATKFVINMLYNTIFFVKLHHKDIFGRYLADVYVGHNESCRNLSLILLKEGLAFMYRHDQSFGKSFRRKLAEVEEYAKNRKKGVWSLDKPVFPKKHSKKIWSKLFKLKVN